MSDDDQHIMITTSKVPTKDGLSEEYKVVVDFGHDVTTTLTEEQALQHGKVILRACAMAEYDHAVYAQMSARVKSAEAFELVRDLQKDRKPFDLGNTEPLLYIPGLARNEERTPVVQIRRVKGDEDLGVLGVWDLDQARVHAFLLIEAPQAAALDTAYLKTLTGMIGLEESTASAVVHELANYRPTYRLLDSIGTLQ